MVVDHRRDAGSRGGINWLAVVVGTAGYVVFGALRYGHLRVGWMRSMGYESTEDVDGDDARTGWF